MMVGDNRPRYEIVYLGLNVDERWQKVACAPFGEFVSVADSLATFSA